MRYILIFLLFVSNAYAYQFNECKFVIEPNPENINDKAPIGHKIYIYKDGNLIHTKWLTVPTMEATCASIFDETAQGDYEAYATAYNDAGESEGTQPIPFVIDEYVSKPATPVLRIEVITVQ